MGDASSCPSLSTWPWHSARKIAKPIWRSSTYNEYLACVCSNLDKWVSRWDSHNSSTSCRLKPCPSLKGFSEANLKVVSDQGVCPVVPNKAKDISSQTLLRLLKWAEAETDIKTIK